MLSVEVADLVPGVTDGGESVHDGSGAGLVTLSHATGKLNGIFEQNTHRSDRNNIGHLSSWLHGQELLEPAFDFVGRAPYDPGTG